MEKTRDLFKKIRDINGTFHAKMGTIKDRNGMDPTGRRYVHGAIVTNEEAQRKEKS